MLDWKNSLNVIQMYDYSHESWKTGLDGVFFLWRIQYFKEMSFNSIQNPNITYGT